MGFIVLDTNVFVAALLSKDGASREIIRLSLQGEVVPLMGEKLFYEYEDVLGRGDVFRQCILSSTEREQLFNAFLASCKWVPIFFLWRPNLPDEGDNHIVELAVAGSAETIVTQNERDFKRGELKFAGIQILTPGDFLKKR